MAISKIGNGTDRVPCAIGKVLTYGQGCGSKTLSRKEYLSRLTETNTNRLSILNKTKRKEYSGVLTSSQ